MSGLEHLNEAGSSESCPAIGLERIESGLAPLEVAMASPRSGCSRLGKCRRTVDSTVAGFSYSPLARASGFA